MKLTPNLIWIKIRNSPLAWDAITTTAWNTLGKAVGFLIPFFLAAWFGISTETDAFFFAYGLIVFAAGIFAPAIESMIIPHIAEIRSKRGDVGRFAGRMLFLSGAGMTVFAVLFISLARPILEVVTKFDTASLRTISRLLFLTAPLLVLLVWTSVLTGLLNAYKKFAFPAIAPAFRAATNLAVIFAFKDTLGVYAIAWGYLAGEAVRLLLLLFATGRSDIPRLKFAAGIDAEIRSFLAVFFFQTLGLAAWHFKLIVDKTMASWLGPGSVSILEYSYRLFLIPISFLTSGLYVAVLSHWSERYYDQGRRQLARDVAKMVKVATAAGLLLVVFFIIFSKPLVTLAYGRGKFDPSQVSVVSLVWICYLLGFVPATVSAVVTRGHLTLKNTKILMRNAIYINLANILFNYLLMWRFRAAGIAISTSITAVFSLFYLILCFRRDDRIAGERKQYIQRTY